MLKKIKLPLSIILLVALLAGFSLPVIGATHFKSPAKMELSDRGKADDPWDPGDESDPVNPVKSFEFKSVTLDPESKLAKRDNDPWDPGDESPHTKGVSYV